MPIKFFQKISPVLVSTIILLIIGLIFISISSLSEAQSTFGDKFYFLKKQAIWIISGITCLLIISKVNLNIIKPFITPAYIVSVVLLGLVLIPGLSNHALGASRWLNLGMASFQPSELYKFIAIPYFSLLFSNESNRNLKTLLINVSIPLILIILEPNLSTTVLVASIVISIYYLSGGEIISLFGACSIGVLLGFILIFTSPYRQARLQTLLNPTDNTSGTSYHSNQIIISLASGGLIGKGIGNSSQKYQFLPQLTTDSILAIIGEETGFIGVSFVIFIYVNLIISIFRISKKCKSLYHQLFSSGIACWIAYQSLINIAAIAAIIPLTGVPLPFISYGGSSMLTLLSAIGIVNNIDNHEKSV